MTLVFDNGVAQLQQADARSLPLADASVHCVVTSPPYWGLRDYGVDEGIGLEPTLGEWLANMRQAAAEAWRVLRNDGTFWLNVGDAYAGSWGAQSRGADGDPEAIGLSGGQVHAAPKGTHTGSSKRTGLKAKSLIGMPWRVALALQEDGWILRSAIVWAKPNPMPESVTDRPTRGYEEVFLLAKRGRYFYDADAIREPYSPATMQRVSQSTFDRQTGGPKDYGGNRSMRRGVENLKARIDGDSDQQANGANARDVWTIATQPRREAHFATFPDELARRCILAGCPEDGTVLDPFVGSGTTCAVAQVARPPLDRRRPESRLPGDRQAPDRGGQPAADRRLVVTVVEFQIVMASYNGSRPRIVPADALDRGWQLVDATEEEYDSHMNQIIWEICAYTRGKALEFQMRRIVGDAAD